MWRRALWSASPTLGYRAKMAAKPFPILFIAGASLEEAITSSGLIKRLSDEVPGARFTIATGEAAAGLYAATPNVEAIVRLEAKPDAREWIAFWRRALDRRWGLVVDLRGCGVGWWLRRKRRAMAHPGQAGRPIHKVIEAAAAFGLEDEPPAPSVYVDERIEAAAEAALGDERPILAVAPRRILDRQDLAGRALRASRGPASVAGRPDGGRPAAGGRRVGGHGSRPRGQAGDLQGPAGRGAGRA